jgi:hypothetical protein
MHIPRTKRRKQAERIIKKEESKKEEPRRDAR